MSADAWAYPWMIKHGYTVCGTCHADPSGSGLLTQYGHAQSALLLSSRYSKTTEEEEPGKFSESLFALVKLPDEVLLGGWVRNGYIWNTADGDLVDRRFLQMRADLAAQVKLGHFRANGTIGYASGNARALSQQASLTSNDDGPNLVSREHWLGADVADDTVLIRAGRFNVPFGLRNVEHTSWVRSETRTDVNQGQQYGAAVSYSAASIRAEGMLIAGNYLVHPDLYRERGLAGYAELAIDEHHTVGVSTLVARAAADISERKEAVRQVHGIFTRLSLFKPLVLLAETDLLLSTVEGAGTKAGYVGLLQLDLEPLQGLHVAASAEALRRAKSGAEKIEQQAH